LPALALVDLRMPVMDGWDFIAAVRALPNRASLPIAVHSSSEEPAPSTACFVLRKPAAPRLLVSKIREHLRPTARSASSES
jgi:CheY-like chemotaxis protein